MLNKLVFIISILVFVIAISGLSDDKKYEYVGVKKCSICHKSEKQGKQKDIWENSGHSKAYTELSSESGMEKAEKLGVDDPTKSEKCLSCHAPEFNKSEQFTKTFKLEDGVQCETCHGAGSAYKKKSIMKDREKSIANGLLFPDEKTCLNCHKKENPEHKGTFNYKEAWDKIKHPVPNKKKAS